MKHVDFFYDYSCPYAYLAHSRVEPTFRRHGATVTWKPFLLGGVFRAIGTPDVPAASMPASKARFNLLDMHRWAAFLDVPFLMPETHPNRTVLALRATLASNDRIRASHALFAAYWTFGLDLSKPEVVVEALDGAGFDGAGLVARAEEPAIKDALRTATDEAIAAGVFGAPAFLVTIRDEPDRPDATELFWGQDRIALVEELLAGAPGSASPLARPTPARLSPIPAAPPPSPERKRLELYFDFSSPFAYLAAMRAPELAARAGAELAYEPFLLGGLFQSIGTPNVPLFEMPEVKRRHSVADMHRWAARFGVPLRFPTRFPMNTVKPLRMALALDNGQRRSFVEAVFRAYWADDRDIADDAVLADLATTAGHDGPSLVARTSDAALKSALRASTERAASRGVFGAPTFFVDDLLFWGQDRMEHVERALSGWRPPNE